MIRNVAILVLIAMFGCFTTRPAFCEDDHAGHAHHDHDTTGYELGLSAGYVHLEEDDEGAPGLHLHISKRLGNEGLMERLALGLGGEVIFADEAHNSLMVPLSVYPWRGLVFAIAPGVLWAEHEGESKSEYATHAEVAYVFEIGNYDLGPAFDYSWTSDEEHYAIGLHFGIHL